MHLDAAANAIGTHQLGVATRRQLREAGVDANAIARRVAAGAWQGDGAVIDLGTHPPTWHQAVLRAVLAAPAGALASHVTAAHLHGFLDVGRPGTIELTVPRPGRNRSMALTLHSTTVPDRGTLVAAVPTVRWPRAARELAARTGRRAYSRVVADLLRRRRDAARLLVAELEACGPTVAGLGTLRAVLTTELGSDRRLLESPLEDVWHRALVRADLRPEVVQHRLRDARGRVIARFDLAWPSALVAVEVDGRGHHSSQEDVAADTARDDTVAAVAGWHVERVTAADLSARRRDPVIDRLRAAIDERKARAVVPDR